MTFHEFTPKQRGIIRFSEDLIIEKGQFLERNYIFGGHCLRAHPPVPRAKLRVWSRLLLLNVKKYLADFHPNQRHLPKR